MAFLPTQATGFLPTISGKEPPREKCPRKKPSPVVIEQVVHEHEVRAAVSDTPKTDTKDDRLEFKPYVDALYGFITAPETTTPLVISINGSWGSGKSSLMRMLKQQLEPREGYYSDLLW